MAAHAFTLSTRLVRVGGSLSLRLARSAERARETLSWEKGGGTMAEHSCYLFKARDPDVVTERGDIKETKRGGKLPW